MCQFCKAVSWTLPYFDCSEASGPGKNLLSGIEFDISLLAVGSLFVFGPVSNTCCGPVAFCIVYRIFWENVLFFCLGCFSFLFQVIGPILGGLIGDFLSEELLREVFVWSDRGPVLPGSTFWQ